MSSATIAVTGASGHLGGAIVAHLVRLGAKKIVAVTRKEKPIAGAELRQADFNDIESLKLAFKDVDRVVLVPTDDLTPGARAKQVSSAIDAAVAAGVKLIAIFGLIGVHAQKLGTVGYEYFTFEQHLIKTVPNNGWVSLRMALFSESAVGLIVNQDGNAVGYNAHSRVNVVARDDLAAAAAAVLVDDDDSERHRGAIYNLTGPHAFNLAELAAVSAKVRGHEVKQIVTDSAAHRALLASFQLPPPVVSLIDDLLTVQSQNQLNIVTGDVERLTGRPPTPFETTLRAATQKK